MANDGLKARDDHRRSRHFPFSIFHLSFPFDICYRPILFNEKWKMENGKWKMIGPLIAFGAVPIIVRFMTLRDWRLYAYS
jgi:hypothetical protein